MSKYLQIQALIERDPDEAHRQARLLLDENPDDPIALTLIGLIEAKAERYGLACSLFRRAVQIKDIPEAWNNVGMALQGLHREKAAREAFMRAHQSARENPAFLANVALTYLEERDYQKVLDWTAKAFKFDPNHAGAKTSFGMACLALGRWKEGWEALSASVGNKFRKEVSYGDEPRWDGTPGKRLVIYGEQGLGDEVMYASCVPDALDACDRVIIDCDSRLEGLFRRSFPTAGVYGTRRQEEVEWLGNERVEARCAFGQLPQFFRPTPESCPGTAYLVADPERRIQWRALFQSWGKKPKIGLAWSGGSRHNHPEARSVGLEAFRPLIESLDADWVSLQYRDAQAEIDASGLPVRQYARATLTQDYDDTAGLVAELDLVIGPHTSVHHLAGALGVPSLILVPKKTIWIYALPSLPWYRGATLVRQSGAWKETIESLLSHPAIRGL